jgi:CRISPR-associated protein (TIGR02710 family)
MTTILICTVGGSHQPIVSAIADQRPDFVIFICTGNDPATGQQGSVSQITGQGMCIKANFGDAKPTLPSIPVQAGLQPEQYRVQSTLADNLDQIYLDCSRAIVEALTEHPDAKLIADYTGGTKSMSAGLVMAVLEHQEIELRLMTGGRSDLIKVQDGSEFSVLANIEQLRFERLLAPYRQAWSRYAYSEAEAGLKLIRPPHNTELQGKYTRFRDLSRAFAKWDNFNHDGAQRILLNYTKQLGPLTAQLQSIGLLNSKKPELREAAQLFDLYLNARRRAAQGRYDDAIARAYRLIEWTAQWLLKVHCGIETANIDEAAIPEGMALKRNREGQWQAGLFDAWQLVKFKTSGAGAQFIKAEENRLLNHLKIRNFSILAHGFEPVKAGDWQTIQVWLAQQFVPMLLAETAKTGIKELPVQLPVGFDLR